MLTKEKLVSIIPQSAKSKLDMEKLVELINQEESLNTPNRLAGFIAQTAHESGGYTVVVENLNYSSTGLLKIFKKYFPNEALAVAYARQPERIANRVYANRMGNGDEFSGDGWRYRGRGFIQLTGKTNYTKFFNSLSKDIDPDYLTSVEGAFLSAVWFWNTNNINSFCDSLDIVGMTRKINGGTNGLEERKHYFDKALGVLS